MACTSTERHTGRLALVRAALVAAAIGLSAPALAGATDPLFVNLGSDEPGRAGMALTFARHHFENGHPLSVFLSDRAVILGVKAGGERHGEQQKQLAELIAKGALVIVSPPGLRQLGHTEADLLPGVTLGGVKVTGEALFRDNTKTMSW